jgi:hypothetical protein
MLARKTSFHAFAKQSGQGPQPKRATARTLLVRFPLVADFLLEKQSFTHL